MSVPNSILSVLLVVVWLFVLVPMFVNRRPKVMTVSQTALNTRVLFRGGLDKLKHRIRPGIADESPIEHEDEDGENGSARRPVAEVFAEEHEELEVADEAEFVEDDAPARRIREEEIVDEAEIVAVDDRRGQGEGQDDPADSEEERLEHVAHRLGRGGYNPTADASARAQRYAVRQRIVLGLLISLVAATVLAFAMTPLVWYAVGAIAATLVGYLSYLRRQVRIEEQIRARRMARFARSQNSRTGPAAADPRPERREQPRPAQAQRPSKKARGPQVVAIDDDDPDFAFLPSPNHGILRRASGE